MQKSDGICGPNSQTTFFCVTDQKRTMVKPQYARTTGIKINSVDAYRVCVCVYIYILKKKKGRKKEKTQGLVKLLG